MDIDLKNYKHYLVVDLEATCCDKDSIERHEMETIEIGAVMVVAATLEIVDEYQTFIKPVKNPILTEFCTELTSITQSDVENAPDYPEAISHFKAWLNRFHDFVFCSWGDYDKGQLERDSQLHNVEFPIEATHVNIKKRFSEAQDFKKGFGMAKALRCAGLKLDGTHHRGLDDARNMVKLMPYILGLQQVKTNRAPSKSGVA